MPIDPNDPDAALEALCAAAARIGRDGLGTDAAPGYFAALARAAPLAFASLLGAALDGDAGGDDELLALIREVAIELGIPPPACGERADGRDLVATMATIADGELAARAFGRIS